MARWTGLLGALFVPSFLGSFLACFLASCDGRLLPDGFPSSTTPGTGGAPTLIVVSPHDGAGGAAGSPGAGGSAGSAGADADGGAPSCDELATLYVAAVEEDKSCDPKSAETQCHLRVIPALCAGCPATTYVNSRAASNAARLRWDMVPCPVPTNCASTCAPLPTSGRCVPTAGGGRCMDVTL